MKVQFVTGKLAAPLLRETLSALPGSFDCAVAEMGISVAALMTTDWIGRFLKVEPGVDLVLLPGHAQGEVRPARRAARGAGREGPQGPAADPRALRHGRGARGLRSPRHPDPGRDQQRAPVHAPEILKRARAFADSGADVIDVGCTKGQPFPGLQEIVRALRAEGHRVSIDTFDTGEIRTAVRAGAELVLSVNGTNLEVARDLGATVIVIPDFGRGLDTLDRSMESLERWGVPFIADPVLEPIAFGFADSLYRYVEVRRRHPKVEMLMGIANLTELLEADSTGVTAVLLGFCQEVGIRHVLTTEEIPWARGATREADVARRLMHYAVTKKSLPKHVDSRLLTVKDAAVSVYSEAELRKMQAQIRDLDFRIFTDGERIHVFNAERFVSGTDVSEIFTALDVQEPSHAFYLGKELTKARLALVLGKTYRQEGELQWGYLTPAESNDGHPRESRQRASRERADRRRARHPPAGRLRLEAAR